MKYPANISGEEYAAMEEGYEQGIQRQALIIDDLEKSNRRLVRQRNEAYLLLAEVPHMIQNESYETALEYIERAQEALRK